MDQATHNKIVTFIWGIADDVLRDLFKRGKYPDVILPMCVLRRLDAVLEPTKQQVLGTKEMLDGAGIAEQDGPLEQAAGQAFYNTSPFTLQDVRASGGRQQLEADFKAYLDGFSENVQDILNNFKFRNQIETLSRGGKLGDLIEKFLDPDINLSPEPVRNSDGSIRHSAMDNHAMGTVFEELVRRFNESNNEEAGEHWTPRDAVQLMADLVFVPVADGIESGTYTIYDGACGTGGMLLLAEERFKALADERGKRVSVYLHGQEISPETFAVCKADLLLRGEGEDADNIKGGAEWSTIANDAYAAREFDFMLSNPPYGKSWKGDQEAVVGEKGAVLDPRFRATLTGPDGATETFVLRHPLVGRADAVPRQHAVEDAHGRGRGQPHRARPQRVVALHRRSGAGREQPAPLDHGERLARGHRRAATQHVLQHRHLDLRLGTDQRQAPAPVRQGAVDRRHRLEPPAPAQPRQEELRARPRRRRPRRGRLHGVRGDRAVQNLPQRRLRTLESDGGSAPAPRDTLHWDSGRGTAHCLRFARRA